MLKLFILSLISVVLSKNLKLLEPEFKNKVVLVTGGTTGIGYATALAFAREGAKVVIVARDSRPECFNGKSAEEKINSDEEVQLTQGNAKFVQADISKRDEVRRVFSLIEQDYGSLDIAVNNAGIGGFIGNIETIPDDIEFNQYDAIINNLYGVFFCMREEVKHFKKYNKNGSILNLSSDNGIRSCPGCSMYSASKYGIIGLTRSVALENLKNPYIRVNAVAPGLVDTFLTRNQVHNLIDPNKQVWEDRCIPEDDELWKKYKPEFTKILLSGRLLEPEELANLIVYASSEKASAITGAILPGDLGESAK